jgi:hypothetical protein
LEPFCSSLSLSTLCAGCELRGTDRDPGDGLRVHRHYGTDRQRREPDGNGRWAIQHGLAKEQGYASGIVPGLALFEACKALGVAATDMNFAE